LVNPGFGVIRGYARLRKAVHGCAWLCKAVQGCAPVLCPWGIANYPFSKLLYILCEFSLGIMGIFTRNIIQAWHPRGTDLNRPRLLEWDYPFDVSWELITKFWG
jgi:hypothetical protein